MSSMYHKTCILILLFVKTLCVFSEQSTHQSLKMYRHRRMTPAFENQTHASANGSMLANGGGDEDKDKDWKKQALINWKKEAQDFSAAFAKAMSHFLLIKGLPGHQFGISTTILLYVTGKMGKRENKDIWSQIQDRVKIEVGNHLITVFL